VNSPPPLPLILLSLTQSYYYAPPLIGRGIKRCICLTSVCLTVAYIGYNSRTERPRNTKIGTEVAHVARDLHTAFKVKRSRSPVRFTHRDVNTPDSCSSERENVLAVGNYCYVAVCRRGDRLGGTRRFGGHRGRREGSILWRPPAHSLLQWVTSLTS